MTTHGQSVQDQFNSKAEAYLTSEVHYQGPDLVHARNCVINVADKIETAVDLGCGAGHLSFVLANVIKHITAVDASAEMVKLVARESKQRGINNIDTVHAGVEALPFADHSIDLVCTRYSAHHWTQMDKAMQEIKRIIKPDGLIMIIDIEGFADPVIDTHFQTIEILRDRSHVRDYSDNEWRAFFQSINFEVTQHQTFPVRLEIASWLKRMQTPNIKIEVIKQMQQEANSQVKEALKIEQEGSFTALTGVWWGKAKL